MFNSIAQFYFNQSVKISSKLMTLILIIFCVWLVDNVTGFSFYKNNSEKISQLRMISDLKDNNNLSEESNILLSEIEQNINSRRSIADKIKITVNSIVQTRFVKKDLTHNNIVPRNNFLLFVLTNLSLIILAILATVGFLSKELKERIRYKILGIFLTWFLLFVFSVIFYLIVSVIPMIGSNWLINYVIAFLIQPLFFIIIYSLTKG